MTVKAPFRFARISRKVHCPAWGELASHDIPFDDGLSGTATITLTTITPLLIGGKRQLPENGQPGQIWPMRRGGRLVIPESAMQGMCRTILEIAAFGRLGPFVDKRHFGIRDLSGTATAKEHYQRRLNETSPGRPTRVTPKTKAGFLRKDSNGNPKIIPCKMARIHVDEVLELLNAKRRAGRLGEHAGGNPFHEKSDARQRYQSFLKGFENLNRLKVLSYKFDIDPDPQWYPHQGGTLEIQYRRARIGNGPNAKPGTLVLTGKHNQGVEAGQKKWEFVFFDIRKNAQFLVEKTAWDAFLYLHEAQKGRDANPNWEFWKDEYERGQPVPIFYWLDETGKLGTLGMAFAFKAAHEKSTHDLLAHSSPDHVADIAEAPLDMAHLIFGIAAEGNKGRGLKRRAWFGPGFAEGNDPEEVQLGPAILLSPKPSYAGLYVRQEARGDQVPRGIPMATYSPARNHKGRHLTEPELAGVKIWPCSYKGATAIDLPPIPDDLQNNHNVQNILHAVPHDNRFCIPLTFHNLRPVELGALLWALSWGDDSAFGEGLPSLHHRMGMGKPLHLGEVALNVKLEVDGENRQAAGFIQLFTKYMEEVCQADGKSWSGSVQVKALLKAANPDKNDSGDLCYMTLGSHRDCRDTYIGEKNRQGFLDDYANGDEFPRPPPPAPAPAPDPAPAPNAGAATLEPVEGARIRFRDNARDTIKGKEGVIVELGADQYANHKIRLDIGKILHEKQGLFIVLSHPDGDG